MEQQEGEISNEDAQKIWDEEANLHLAKEVHGVDYLPEEPKEPEVAEASDETEEEPQQEEVSEEETQEEVVAQEATEESEQPEKVEDPFDGLPDAVKQKLAQIDELAKSNANLLHHVKTAEGRVAALQREAEINRRVKEEVEKTNAPSQKQIEDASKSSENWEQLKADYPEFASGLEEYIASKLSSVPKAQSPIDPKQIAGYVNNQIANSKQEMARRIEEAQLDGKYDTWRDDVKTQDFNTWLSSQPTDIRSLADSNSAKDAMRMLDLFYDTKKKPVESIKQSRTARLAKAANPDKRTQTPPPKSIEDMTAEELWNYEARKRERLKEQRGY